MSGYRCRKCYGHSDAMMPLLDTLCSACQRNEELLRGQQRIVHEQNYNNSNGLEALERKLRSEFDRKLQALADYLEKKIGK